MPEPITDRDPGDETACPRRACRGILHRHHDGTSHCARCGTRFGPLTPTERPGRLAGGRSR